MIFYARTTPIFPGFTLAKRSKDCNDNYKVDLKEANTLAECAQRCKERNKCYSFEYGIGTNSKKCFGNELTNTFICTKGWETDDYNVYQLQGIILLILQETLVLYLTQILAEDVIFCLTLGQCQWQAIPSNECPAIVNDNTTPPCKTTMPHGQLCEGDSNIHPDGQLGMNDNLDNCGGDDIYKCIRGNQKLFLVCRRFLMNSIMSFKLNL